MKKAIFLILTTLLWSCSKDRNSIKIKGSDTEVNLAVELAEKFYSQNSNFSLAVSGGGSGLGIASLYNGQADIANSSRPLSDDEKSMFREKGIKLITNVFAEDATAIVVNPQVPVDEIDVPTLSKIFSGEITNWKSLTGNDLPINIYGRQSNSGTHSFVQKKLKIKFSQKAKEMNGNAQIMEGIKADASGIGYVGAGYLLNEDQKNMKVKALKISEEKGATAISPLDHEAIKAKKYFFQRPLYQFIPEKSWEAAKPFIDFEKTETGKEIIRKSGYYVVD
ncbi:PstS family phosphate ABC transporter substrate-binding protein [Chryseobacterium taklimakanense]|uniref:PstS family phosphate ABC transporter substrate-binding protein n=1 Tax=Chryseobacterium taklimakanense TaxID=536441 RepID=UPI000F5E0F01|nr:PstS family phosphate ABC transporter substrate-binding protein [Chryseobacterium taklimakanense]AZI23044.1 PstS family phosphate ABC transporter substrate-binding protein [Chryseobacterium taklimakanense]